MNFLNKAWLIGGLAILAYLWFLSADYRDPEQPKTSIVDPPSSELSSYFKNSRGLWLFYRTWAPEETPKALLFLVHGYGEHSGRLGYHNLAQTLTKSGYAVFALDHEGHGRSNGERAYVMNFSHYIEDLDVFIKMIEARYPKSVPKFILGHSMGSLVAFHSVMENQERWKGFVCSGSPAYIEQEIYATTTFKIVSFLAKTLPKVPMWLMKGLNGSYISRNKTAITHYDLDPLNYRGFYKARWMYEFLMAISSVEKLLPGLNIPLFIFHGSEDKITKVEGSKMIYNLAGSSDKTLKLYEGGFHEMWEDELKEEVFGDIVQWLDKRLV